MVLSWSEKVLKCSWPELLTSPTSAAAGLTESNDPVTLVSGPPEALAEKSPPVPPTVCGGCCAGRKR